MMIQRHRLPIVNLVINPRPARGGCDATRRAKVFFAKAAKTYSLHRYLKFSVASVASFAHLLAKKIVWVTSGYGVMTS